MVERGHGGEGFVGWGKEHMEEVLENTHTLITLDFSSSSLRQVLPETWQKGAMKHTLRWNHLCLSEKGHLPSRGAAVVESSLYLPVPYLYCCRGSDMDKPELILTTNRSCSNTV